MSTKTTPATKPVDLDDLDFDAPYDEDAAIAEAVAALTPKYMVVGGTSLAARFPDGTRIRISLAVTHEVLTEIGDAHEGAVDQIKELLLREDQPEAVAILEKQGSIAAVAFATRYFELYAKIVGASLGESQSSSK